MVSFAFLLPFLFTLIPAGQAPPLSKPLPDSGEWVLAVDKIKRTGGILWIGIYASEEDFLVKERSILLRREVTTAGQISIPVPDLPYGTYAVALFHDVNSNGTLDRNLVGIPREPYAFSRKLKSKWRLPRFDEVAVEFKRDGQQLKTVLKTWWGH